MKYISAIVFALSCDVRVARGRKVEDVEEKPKTLLSLPLVPYENHPQVQEDESYHYRYRRSFRRRRRLDEDDFLTTTDPLYQGYGTHYVDLWVGTPPQRQTLIVDTGSAVTAFPCSECGGCGRGYHIDQQFVEKRSSTFKVVPCNSCMLGYCPRGSRTCQRSVAYQEGSSWKAYEGEDVVYSGGSHNSAISSNNTFWFRFACQTELTGLFRTQLADGIMGMEMADEAFWHQMHANGALADKKFSLCFGRRPTASRDGTNAGVMTLGGANTRLHETPMVYAKQLNAEGWYAVDIRKIYLRTRGGDRVVSSNRKGDHVVSVRISESDLNANKNIIDSGTTDTYLTSKLAKPFSSAWKDLTGREYDNGSHRYHDGELLALPTILFQLAGDRDSNRDHSLLGLAGELDKDNPSDIVVAMSPRHYMEYDTRTKKYRSRLYFNQRHGGVLGANFIMGHDVLFDVDNDRLGFAESSCDFSSIDGDEKISGRSLLTL